MSRCLVILSWCLAVGWLSVATARPAAGPASRPAKARARAKAPARAKAATTGKAGSTADHRVQKRKASNRFRQSASPRSRPAPVSAAPTPRRPAKRGTAQSAKRVRAKSPVRTADKRSKAAARWAQVIKSPVKVVGPSGVQEVTVPVFVNGLGMRFSRVPPGKFTMGSPATERGRNDDERAYPTRFRQPYFISTTEVTVGQWRRFIQASGFAWDHWSEVALVSPTDDHPIVYVSWADAAAFCKWLSKIDRAAYRLPGEAEWEYACRAGAATAFSFGDEPRPGLMAYDGREVTAFPVTAFPANRWGLYGMHGNVWEWCRDWYRKTSSWSRPTTSRTAPPRGDARNIRSGSWQDTADYCRSANRSGRWPEGRYEDLGFRVVRTGP